MITNFTTLAGSGLRHITINNKNSLADYGVLICKETETDGFAAKSIAEDLPRTDGIIDMSLYNGVLHYEPRTLRYRFKVCGDTPQAYEAKKMQLTAWLNGAGRCSIADSNYTEITNGVTAQWLFTNCIFKGIEVEAGEKGEVVYGYITAVFACDPFMIKQGTANDRIVRFTAQGTQSAAAATITVTNNSAYSVARNGTSTPLTGSYTAAEPYTYRVVAYSENAPTVTLDGVTVDISQKFTLDSNATIVISAEGYGYYELWHDTREVRL